MSPHRRPRYQLWGVYYGPCHQIPPHDDGHVRHKYYVVVRVCATSKQVYCALINTDQANLPGIVDCQIALTPSDVLHRSMSSKKLTNPQSWLSLHTSSPGGRLHTLPRYVMPSHEFVGVLNGSVSRAIPQLIGRCKNISRAHKAILLGDADC